MNKAERELRLMARGYGCALIMGSKHWKLLKGGALIAATARTPSDRRGLKNLRAVLCAGLRMTETAFLGSVRAPDFNLIDAGKHPTDKRSGGLSSLPSMRMVRFTGFQRSPVGTVPNGYRL